VRLRSLLRCSYASTRDKARARWPVGLEGAKNLRGVYITYARQMGGRGWHDLGMALERKSSNSNELRVQLRKVLLRFSLNKRKLWHSTTPHNTPRQCLTPHPTTAPTAAHPAYVASLQLAGIYWLSRPSFCSQLAKLATGRHSISIRACERARATLPGCAAYLTYRPIS
jgi:hypothetical protein